VVTASTSLMAVISRDVSFLASIDPKYYKRNIQVPNAGLNFASSASPHMVERKASLKRATLLMLVIVPIILIT
jgi:hypothetical protein